MSEATNVKRVIVLDDHVDVRLVLNSIITIVSTSADIAYRHSSPNYTLTLTEFLSFFQKEIQNLHKQHYLIYKPVSCNV